jgi:hypothetical protein
VNALSYNSTLNLIQILHATLTILENTEYPANDSKEVAELKRCLESGITTIEAAMLQVSTSDRQ